MLFRSASATVDAGCGGGDLLTGVVVGLCVAVGTITMLGDDTGDTGGYPSRTPDGRRWSRLILA